VDEVIDSLELHPASELEVQLVRLPSGEVVVRFEDCTGLPPVIYRECFEEAIGWVRQKLSPSQE
jgi:hypothetical protein